MIMHRWRIGQLRLYIDTIWGKGFNLSLKSSTYHEGTPHPWWFRVGPLAISWRWP